MRPDHHLALLDEDVGHGDARVACGEHTSRRRQRWYEEGAAVEHHLDRFVVEVDAVLDRPDARADSRLDAVGRLRVGHHELACCRRLGDEHLELVVAEVAVARIVTR